MITARQIRAARVLLGWSLQDLARHAGLSLNGIKRLESGHGDPRMSTVRAVKSALEAGGLEFVPAGDGKGEGVRLAVS